MTEPHLGLVLEVQEGRAGVYIVGVSEGSDAKKYGVQAGDRLISVEGHDTSRSSIAEVAALTSKADPVTMRFRRIAHSSHGTGSSETFTVRLGRTCTSSPICPPASAALWNCPASSTLAVPHSNGEHNNISRSSPTPARAGKENSERGRKKKWSEELEVLLDGGEHNGSEGPVQDRNEHGKASPGGMDGADGTENVEGALGRLLNLLRSEIVSPSKVPPLPDHRSVGSVPHLWEIFQEARAVKLDQIKERARRQIDFNENPHARADSNTRNTGRSTATSRQRSPGIQTPQSIAFAQRDGVLARESALLARVRHLEGQVDELQSVAAARLADIERTHVRLDEALMQCSKLKETMAQRGYQAVEEDILVSDQRGDARHDIVDDLRQQHAEEMHAIVREKDAALRERDAARMARDCAVEDLHNAIRERDAAVSERDRAVTEQSALTLELRKRNAVISHLVDFVSTTPTEDYGLCDSLSVCVIKAMGLLPLLGFSTSELSCELRLTGQVESLCHTTQVRSSAIGECEWAETLRFVIDARADARQDLEISVVKGDYGGVFLGLISVPIRSLKVPPISAGEASSWPRLELPLECSADLEDVGTPPSLLISFCYHERCKE